jgi:hypothetical protein
MRKAKLWLKFGYENWLWNCALLLTRGTLFKYQQPLKILKNRELQDQYKFVFDRFGALVAFEMHLRLFRKQLENLCFSHSSSCVLLHKDGSVSVPFLSVRAIEMAALAENFKISFSDFRSHATNVRRLIFEGEFFIEVCDAPEKLQLGLTQIYSVVSTNKVKLFLYFFSTISVL